MKSFRIFKFYHRFAIKVLEPRSNLSKFVRWWCDENMFVGSPILAQLVSDGLMDDIREVLEKSEPSWRAADSVDSEGQSLIHLEVAQGQPDLVQLLLEFEHDVEAQSRSGSTPLDVREREYGDMAREGNGRKGDDEGVRERE